MAIYGWETLKEAERYTRRANRKRLAAEAMHLLVPVDETATDFPTFSEDTSPVGKFGRKNQ
ncbi:hypothetical protein [Nitratireductor luteus]|uniref:hypothetical protein n=1 Tax=Nitratireductor luteus TaxID=2976980 RepID=UPI002240C49B|nr:hypothetical protein [Nitratireductor luteus]